MICKESNKAIKYGNLNGVNVLVITSGHDATDHRVYYKLACSLKRLGANVVVVGKLGDPLFSGEVPVLEVQKPSSRLQRFFWQPWRCFWIARKYKADIVHFHDAEFLLTLPLAKLIWPKRKFVYDVHEDFANLMLVRDWLPYKIRGFVCLLTDLIEKKLTTLAHAVVGVTPLLTHKFSNDHRITAYNFISNEFFELSKLHSRKPQEREFDLVHLGTLNLKRSIFLAKTIQIFHKLRPKAKSIVIGISPEIPQNIRALFPENCLMIDNIPHLEVPKMLGNAKVGIDIHPWIDLHLEVAFPVKICEYMASGCAVVTSAMPVVKQIFEKAQSELNCIEIIDEGIPTEYARAVVKKIEAIEKGKNLGEKLHKFALNHMIWENEVDKITMLYLKLLRRKP